MREKCGRHECEQYKISNNDLFKTSSEIDKIHHESHKKVEKCSRFTEECPAEIKTNELLHITFVVFVLGKEFSTKFIFFDARNTFINFLDSEIDRLKDLLHAATRPRVEIPCREVEPEIIVNDMCSKFSGSSHFLSSLRKNFR